MENDLYYHSEIKFKVLRETKKAVLVKIISCKSPEANNFLMYHKNYDSNITSLLELWFPKSWFKKRGADFFIWEKGLLLNLKKLIEKRKATEIQEEIKETDELIEEFDSLENEIIENKNRRLH